MGRFPSPTPHCSPRLPRDLFPAQTLSRSLDTLAPHDPSGLTHPQRQQEHSPVRPRARSDGLQRQPRNSPQPQQRPQPRGPTPGRHQRRVPTRYRLYRKNIIDIILQRSAWERRKKLLRRTTTSLQPFTTHSSLALLQAVCSFSRERIWLCSSPFRCVEASGPLGDAQQREGRQAGRGHSHVHARRDAQGAQVQRHGGTRASSGSSRCSEGLGRRGRLG